MQNTTFTARDPLPGTLAGSGGNSSAIAWSAILGGAVGAVSLSLILLILGSGLGLAVMPSADHEGPSAVTVTSAAVIWLVFMQWVSSGLGGYIAGRLRTKYVSVHTDEMFFRDTAHGFLSWSVASIFTAALFALAVSSGISGGAHIMAAGAGGFHPGMERPMGAPHGAGPMNGPMETHMYMVDTLFRSDRPATAPEAMQTRGEASRILLTGLANGDVSQADRTYLASLISSQTGIAPAEASKRVDDAVVQMQNDKEKIKDAAEKARKAGATLSVFTFLSLLIGAFIASVAGALGGKRRDEYAL